jgi:hypothetical protein
MTLLAFGGVRGEKRVNLSSSRTFPDRPPRVLMVHPLSVGWRGLYSSCHRICSAMHLLLKDCTRISSQYTLVIQSVTSGYLQTAADGRSVGACVMPGCATSDAYATGIVLPLPGSASSDAHALGIVLPLPGSATSDAEACQVARPLMPVLPSSATSDARPASLGDF